MKKSLKAIFGLMLLSLVLASTARAAVVVSFDQNKKCDNYRVTTEEKPKLNNEMIVIEKEVYGLSTQNQEIDFERRRVHVDIMALVVLGFNKRLTSEKIFISDSHDDFQIFINQLNRKVFLFEEICLSRKGEVIKFKSFEPET